MTRPTRAEAGGRAYLDLQNLARRGHHSTQALMVMYVLERFLARLSISPYADRFILKGGMLLAVWDARRATVDADFLARNLTATPEAILDRIVEIASLPASIEDGVHFETSTAKASVIRDSDIYSGVRVSMNTTIAGAIVKLRLDISTGDPVAPPPSLVTYPALRTGHPSVQILGYPMSVVLAEKLSTAIELGTTNTRVRDYADIWTLTQHHDIPAAELYRALEATAGHRQVVLTRLAEIIDGYGTLRAREYATYLQRLGPDAARLPQSFSTVVDDVLAFADPILNRTTPSSAEWTSSAQSGWRTGSADAAPAPSRKSTTNLGQRAGRHGVCSPRASYPRMATPQRHSHPVAHARSVTRLLGRSARMAEERQAVGGSVGFVCSR